MLKKLFTPSQVDLPPAPSSTAAMLSNMMQQPKAQKPRYYLDAKEANALFMFAVRDFIWAYTSSINAGWNLESATDFWQEAFGQQLWSTVGVAAAVPVCLFATTKFYGASFKNSIIHASISGLTSISSIIPWGGVAKLGKDLFASLGYSGRTVGYLASIFPGPGLAEGPVETLVSTGLSYKFDPAFTFNRMSFVLGLSPISFISGDLWLTVYTAFEEISESSSGNSIAQATAVCLTQLLFNYLTMKSINGLVEKYQQPKLHPASDLQREPDFVVPAPTC